MVKLISNLETVFYYPQVDPAGGIYKGTWAPCGKASSCGSMGSCIIAHVTNAISTTAIDRRARIILYLLMV